MDKNHVLSVINLLQTTSPSYLLMVSLDIARKQLALFGKKQVEKIIEMSNYARNEINAMKDYYAFSKEKANQPGFYDFDLTKLSIHTYQAGFSGIEVYETLRDEYDIQIEFGDLSNILAIVSFGDRYLDIERLLASLSDIKSTKQANKKTMILHEYIHPSIAMTPQQAYNAKKEIVAIQDSVNRICGESIMAYPPGIPIISYGERISEEVIQMIEYIKANHGFLMGASDNSLQSLKVIKEKNNGIMV
jgi:lysine decarboxylase